MNVGKLRHWRAAITLVVGLYACTMTIVSFSARATVTPPRFGPFGPQGVRMREQLWVLPSASPDIDQRTTVFRPPNDAPMPAGATEVVDTSGGPRRRPMVVINHGTSEATRLAVSMPVYYWLSRWFVERGYVVVLPQRRGHGATGGDLVEAHDSCAKPDHYDAGRAASDDIAAAIDYMARQPFVDPTRTIVVGVSTGGWAALALAARNLPNVRAVINFAGGLWIENGDLTVNGSGLTHENRIPVRVRPDRFPAGDRRLWPDLFVAPRYEAPQ